MALQPSKLTDQTELLKDDLDLASLNLAVKGRASLDLITRVTTASVTRTIEGASVLEVTLDDRDWTVSRSGQLAAQVDTEIDGLWFRLKAYDRQGDDLTLTFEDREVAILRDYPKSDAPDKGVKRWDARIYSRIDVARQLVAEVTELKIPFVTLGAGTPITSSSAAPTKTTQQVQRAPGFSPNAKITVKNHPATSEQRSNIDRVLRVGASMGLGVSVVQGRTVLVASVMTVTQESDSVNLPGGDRDSVGLFQQRASEGWPATRDIETDAHEFFKRAIAYQQSHPGVDPASLAQAIQNSGYPTAYAQWRTEAEHTVTAWGIGPGADTTAAATFTSTDKSFQFMRGTQTTGQNGTKIFTREDNWSMLQRLASEVNWRCFCVSGVIYFVTDADLLRSAPRMSITPTSPGIDSINGSFDEGRLSRRKGHRIQHINQQVSIPCRLGRWQAPPGSVVEIDETGIFDGRWIVNTIQRGLFSPDGTVTGKRPQTALPEAQAPEYLQVGNATFASTGDLTVATSAIRAAIVAAAQKSVTLRADYRYAQVRPMPSSLFSGTFPKLVDCSSHFTLVYKAANAPDPNGFGYNDEGDTATLAANGTWTQNPQPGDAAFFGDTRAKPHHVAVYIGDGQVVNMGAPGEPIVEAVADIATRLPLLGYMNFLTDTQTPSDTAHHR